MHNPTSIQNSKNNLQTHIFSERMKQISKNFVQSNMWKKREQAKHINCPHKLKSKI